MLLKSKTSNDVLKNSSQKLEVEGTIYDIIEAFMKRRNDHLKIGQEEYESNFNDYRDKDEEERDNYINKKLGELSIHKFLQQLGTTTRLIMDLGLNHSYMAMSDPKSIYLRTETGYAYTPDMNDEVVRKFNEQKFSQGSAILKVNYYCLKKLIVQHIPVEGRVEKWKLILCAMVIL